MSWHGRPLSLALNHDTLSMLLKCAQSTICRTPAATTTVPPYKFSHSCAALGSSPPGDRIPPPLCPSTQNRRLHPPQSHGASPDAMPARLLRSESGWICASPTSSEQAASRGHVCSSLMAPRHKTRECDNASPVPPERASLPIAPIFNLLARYVPEPGAWSRRHLVGGLDPAAWLNRPCAEGLGELGHCNLLHWSCTAKDGMERDPNRPNDPTTLSGPPRSKTARCSDRSLDRAPA